MPTTLTRPFVYAADAFFGVLRWPGKRDERAVLRAKSPDQREDLGLTLRDMAVIGR